MFVNVALSGLCICLYYFPAANAAGYTTKPLRGKITGLPAGAKYKHALTKIHVINIHRNETTWIFEVQGFHRDNRLSQSTAHRLLLNNPPIMPVSFLLNFQHLLDVGVDFCDYN
jgi:hypothetical protein